MFEKPVLAVVDPQSFGVVRTAVETSFSTGKVAGFLKSVDRAGLRIRDFESVLGHKLLGPQAAAEYNRLSDGDQGQIRELYLASLEQVAPELRRRFFRLYSYY